MFLFRTLAGNTSSMRTLGTLLIVPSLAQWISLEMVGTEEAESPFQIDVTLQAVRIPGVG